MLITKREGKNIIKRYLNKGCKSFWLIRIRLHNENWIRILNRFVFKGSDPINHRLWTSRIEDPNPNKKKADPDPDDPD